MAEWISDDKLGYLDHFGLDREPFTPEVDNVSFFQDVVINQRLGMLQHFSRYSDLLLLVVGENGAGKTTLLHHFIRQLDEGIKVSRVEASATMSREGLLIAIGKGFGLPPILEGDIQAFVKQVQELLRYDEGGLLVIDDAHLLPADTLHYALELAQISGSQGKLLRVILFAEPQIEQVLAEPGLSKLGERITHTLDIPPFDAERTEDYIRHRLSTAGLDGDIPFDKSDFKRIHKGSHGNPARINDLAQAQLLELAGDPDARTRKPARYITLVVAAVLVMVAVAVMVLMQQGGRRQVGQETAQAGQEGNGSVVLPLLKDTDAPAPHLKGFDGPADEAAPGGDQPAAEASTPPQGGETAAAGEQSAPAPEPAQNSEAATAADSKASAEPTGPEASVVAESPTPVITGVSPSPVVGSPRRQSITIHGKDFDPKARVNVGWTGKTRELDNWQVRVVSAEKIVFRVITGTQDDTWTARVINPHEHGSNVYSFRVVSPKSPEATRVTVPKPKARPETSDSDWLFQREPDHYTLQVLASRNGLAVANYYKDKGLENVGHIIAYHKGDQQWYTLVYGDYPSKEAADSAAQTLSVQLNDGKKPWSRSMSGLQQLVLSGHVEGAPWIKVQSASRYTLQLVAGSSRETVEAFVGEHLLTGDAAIYQTVHDGQPWYVLVYGVYDNQQQAQAAIAGLPPAVQKLKPWARSFASVQSEIH